MRERSTSRALQLSAGAIDVIITKGSAAMILRQRTLALVVLTLLAVAPAIQAQSDQADRVREAATVFEEIMSAEDNAVPNSILDKAEGIAVFPSTVKGGFIFGAHRGRGVISARDVKSGTWSAPAFLTLTGGSFGAQIGGQAVDIVLVIMNRRGLERLLENQFKIGADASIAGGPVGRYAEASTDVQLRAEILSYSRTRGLFVGMTLQGSTIREDGDSNEVFYGRPFRTREIVLDGKATTPQSSDAVDRWIGTLKR
jgi:lipid-binding SYLF domain-containing protein